VTAVKFNFRLNGSLIARLVVYVGVVFLMAYGGRELIATWWIGFLGMLAAAMVFAMLLKLIDLRAMIRLIFSSEP
jgi:hypothetical protein